MSIRTASNVSAPRGLHRLEAVADHAMLDAQLLELQRDQVAERLVVLGD
jgi:hypothetical protein